MEACDQEIQSTLASLQNEEISPWIPCRRRVIRNGNPMNLCLTVREALFRVLGIDLSQIDGFSAYTALKLVGECGMDMSRWPTEKHFTSWLTLAPGNKISGGKVLKHQNPTLSESRRSDLSFVCDECGPDADGAWSLLPTVASRAGKAKAVTATARKLAVLFYNTLRYGMAYEDPGAAYYEDRYRQRVLNGLHRRAEEFGYELTEVGALEGVS